MSIDAHTNRVEAARARAKVADALVATLDTHVSGEDTLYRERAFRHLCMAEAALAVLDGTRDAPSTVLSIERQAELRPALTLIHDRGGGDDPLPA